MSKHIFLSIVLVALLACQIQPTFGKQNDGRKGKNKDTKQPNGGGNKERKTKGKAKTNKAGLIFSFKETEKYLQEGDFFDGYVDEFAAIFLASTLEYLSTLVLGAASMSVFQTERKSIFPDDIAIAVKDDANLNKLLGGVSMRAVASVSYNKQKSDRKASAIRVGQKKLRESAQRNNRESKGLLMKKKIPKWSKKNEMKRPKSRFGPHSKSKSRKEPKSKSSKGSKSPKRSKSSKGSKSSKYYPEITVLYDFSHDIKRMAKHVDPDTPLSVAGLHVMIILVCSTFARIGRRAAEITNENNLFVLSVSEMKVAIIDVLPDDLAQMALIEGTEALERFHGQKLL